MALIAGAKKLTDEEIRRLSWRCRRGLLELDIVLQRFSEQHLANLSATELIAFDNLLDLPDNEFLDVVTGRITFADNTAHDYSNKEAMQQVLIKLSSN